MKKLIAILMCILMVASLVACSSAKTDETTAPTEEATTQAENNATEAPVVEGTGLEALKNKMVAEFGLKDPIVLDNGRLLDQYGITEDTIASQSSIIVLTGVFPAEIIMVEATDEAAAKDIEAKLQARLDNLKQQSQSYDADSYAIASACEVEAEGNYVALFFSEHNEAMVEMFNENF
ncbi:MAG: DUF4358 domain-containing protein [Clostridia bacterium]|nr:DUF4358 domain-containing protein [Clostridia bacterium]